MSDQTLRTAGEFVHILAFAVVGGVWLIGGAVFAAYLARNSLGVPNPMNPLPRGAPDRTEVG